MKKNTTKNGVLWLLILLFTAPGLAAYLFYSHPQWLGGTRTNRGIILENSIELTSLSKHEKWRILFWEPNRCEIECLKTVDTLARVRLALGRRLYLVEQALLVDNEQISVSTAIKQQLAASDFAIHSLSADDRKKIEQLSTKPQIYVMDPNNYLVLSYSVQTKPQDIFKDLKLLLNNYELKKG